MKNQAHYLESTTHDSATCACGFRFHGKGQFEALKGLERHIRNPRPVPEQQPFMESELFPGLSNTCRECGAVVAQHDTHVSWHNKVADL